MTAPSWAAAACLLALYRPVFAETTKTGAAVPVTAGMTQVALALLAVLLVVIGLAWLVRRLSTLHVPAGRAIHVLGAAAIGQRERVVLMEVSGTWIIVGVAPGRVNALHTMPRPAGAESPSAPVAAAHGFSDWLRQTLERKSRG